MDIKVIVAAHKKYDMPKDSMYRPIHVGAEGKESIGFTGDNTGDNISTQNQFYCELTGLYWGWKNLNCDYIGLAHYRRHFSVKKKGNRPIDSVLTSEEAEQILKKYDLILPKKRNYYIDTLESHFNHVKFTKGTDLPMLRASIEKVAPEYVPFFDKNIKKTSGHMFNMFIMKKDLADQYCEWLFAVLGDLEKTIDLSTDFHPARRRMLGYLAEFMVDIWVEKNGIQYKEVNTIFLEKQNEIKEIYKFIKRKFRYEQ